MVHKYHKELVIGVLLTLLLLGCIRARKPDRLYIAISSRNLANISDCIAGGEVNLDEMSDGHKNINPILYIWSHAPDKIIIQYLVANGANVNFKDADGTTLLMFASGAEPTTYGVGYIYQNFSTIDLCRLFLENGADVNKRDLFGFGMSAIDYAAWGGDVDRLKLLMQYGANMDSRTLNSALKEYDGYCRYQAINLIASKIVTDGAETSLSADYEAAVTGDSEALIKFCNSNPNSELSLETLFSAAAFCDETALQCATRYEQSVEKLRDADDNSLLDVAAMYGNLSCLRYLIRVTTWSEDELQSALKCSVGYDQYEATKILLESGAYVNPNPYQGAVQWEIANNILREPSQNGNIQLIQLLIDYGYPVNETTAWFAMKNAAQTGQNNVIQFFYELGFDVNYNACNAQAFDSVLRDACAFEQLSTVKYLVELGANVNPTKKCIPIAAERGNYDLCKYLIEAGADANAATVYEDKSESETAIEVARRKGYTDILELLSAPQ